MDLHAKPFYLDDKQIEWVENTLKGLSVEDKLGQLFLYMYMAPDAESDDFETEVNNCNEFLGKMDNLGIRPGGMLFRSAPAKLMRKRIATFQEHYDIPLLVASDLERGSGGVISEGTACGAQMEIAATGDKELAYKAGLQCARECAAVGWN